MDKLYNLIINSSDKTLKFIMIGKLIGGLITIVAAIVFIFAFWLPAYQEYKNTAETVEKARVELTAAQSDFDAEYQSAKEQIAAIREKVLGEVSHSGSDSVEFIVDFPESES